LADTYKDLGHDQAAEQAYLRAAELALARGHTSVALKSVCGRVLIARRYGRLPQAAHIAREALGAMDEPVQQLGRGLPGAGLLKILLGRILLEWNELAAAEKTLREGLDQSALNRGHVLRAMGTIALARTLVIGGKGNKESLPNLDSLLGQPWSAFDDYVTALRAWIILLRVRHAPGSKESAAEWQEVLRWAMNRPLATATVDYDIRAGLLQSRLLIEAYRTYGEPSLGPILAYLDDQLAFVQEKGWIELMIDASIQQAMARQALDNQEQAIVALARALELAEPGAWMRNFLDEGAPMQKQLASVNSQISPKHSLRAYIGKMLSAFDRDATPTYARDSATSSEPPSSVPRPLSLPLDPLSDRELDVLRYLPTHLSSTDIARELYVSRNTVRSHIGHIYSKLGVHSRAEAVERARELDLL
jgi:LuxR family maltose regulon positive regulatory protein